jgi:hypothetical protein
VAIVDANIYSAGDLFGSETSPVPFDVGNQWWKLKLLGFEGELLRQRRLLHTDRM